MPGVLPTPLLTSTGGGGVAASIVGVARTPSDGTDATGASLALTIPGGTATDDYAVLIIELWDSTATNPTLTYPGGFTQIVNYVSTTDGFEKLKVAIKPLTAADSGTYSVSGFASHFRQGHVAILRGIDLTTALDVAVNLAQNSTGTALPANSVTTVTNGCLLLHAIANENTCTGLPATGYTEQADSNYTKTNTKIQTTAGTDSISGGSFSASTLKLGALIAFRPAAGGTNASAGNSAGTGTANNPQASIGSSSATASATGTANVTTSQVSPGPSNAAATGAAQAPSPSLKGNGATASATGVANNASITTGSATSASAEAAVATGTAQAATSKVATGPTAAAGTGTANNATVTTSGATNAAASTATATGTANLPSSKVSPSPTVASATGAANNPSVQSGSFTNATASAATATGSAQTPSAKISPTPTVAAASGAANNAAAGSSVNVSAGLASATGTANAATPTRATNALAGLATATGTVSSGRWSLAATAGAAIAVATAFDALIAGAETNAQSNAAVTGNTSTPSVSGPGRTAMVTARRRSTPEVTD